MMPYSVNIMKTIYFHGYLKDLHPEPIRVHADSVYEALSALALYPEFDPKTGKKFTVVIPGFGSADAINDKTDVEEIHLHPVETGAGGGRAGTFIMGAVLFVVGVIIAVVGSIVPGAQGLVPVGIGIANMGLAMMFMGIIQMLMPQPKLEGISIDERRSQYLGARQNTVAIGTHIPIIMGRCKAWGHYISFDVDAGVLNDAPASWYSSNFTDYGALTYSAAPDEISSLQPGVVDNEPLAVFTSFSGDQLFFTPAQTLETGQLDVTFSNGRSLHVTNPSSSPTQQVTVLGGNTSDLPASGTSIVFTKNYV